MLELHLVALAACVVITGGAVLLSPGVPARPSRLLLVALSPFVFAGLCSLSLLSLNGAPSVEWFIPAVCFGIVYYFCRAHYLATVLYVVFVLLSAVLWLNFISLVDHGYTAAPEAVSRLNEGRQQNIIASGRKAILSAKSRDTPFMEGSVASQLGDEQYDNIDDVQL